MQEGPETEADTRVLRTSGLRGLMPRACLACKIAPAARTPDLHRACRRRSRASSSSAGINLGGANLASTALTAGYTAATATFGAGISSVDLTTAAGAQNAISTIDAALANINSSRASLGALQNRFSSVVSNLATTSENLSASRSRILDADFAAETANLTRAQIMQQAGTAMLAQANSLPQNVLSLLKG